MFRIESATIGTTFCSARIQQGERFYRDDGVQQAASTSFNAIEELDLKHRIAVRKRPAGSPVMQIFFLHILIHPTIYHTNCAFYH